MDCPRENIFRFILCKNNATSSCISNHSKGFSYNDRLSHNLSAIGEPNAEKDQILQLLGGLAADYNSIVASLTAWDDDISLHFVNSILLTHE